MRKDRIYLDYNATAPLLEEARAAMLAAMDLPGNPSSVHADGRAARAMVNAARRQVALLVGAEPSHVTFTSGASEAASHVLSPDFKMGRASVRVGRLYVSAIEHPAVLSGGRFAADDVEIVPVDGNGVIDLAALRACLASHPGDNGLPMVAVMLANNESGVIQPIAAIADLVRAAGGILVVDAVQAAARIPFSMAELGADFLILSAHKIGGPKGVGALISRGEMLMPAPLVTGGGQEMGHRSGTENLIGIVGFGAAAHIGQEMLASERERLAGLTRSLEDGLKAAVPDAVILSRDVERLPNTTFVAVPGLKAETAQIAFDLEGIAVSSGSACSSGKVGESHVIRAMGGDARSGALRISIGRGTGPDEIERFLGVMAQVATRRERAAA
ncbi:cysteine desulfurase family protein [Pararhizobium haloflavum]|uniref:cysteine desulfurase family protein n=1 Tax=Pararhizobium haloflavum TaxID=2037914 RepID=UPI000C197E3C|nr:cysteine desulfurase family protein [Pararhizobium haloflavum]